MPVHRKRDTNGCYYQWGDHGAKYYYKAGDAKSRRGAFEKAALQGRAIKWRQQRIYGR